MGKAKKIGLGIAIGFAALIVLGAIGSYVSEDTVKSNYIQKEDTSKSIPIGDKKNQPQLVKILLQETFLLK